MPNAKAIPDAFGLSGVQADRQASKYQNAFDTKNLNEKDEAALMCSNDRMLVSPYAYMSVCDILVVDRPDHLTISARFDRRDLARWRSIRQSLLAIVHSFRA